MPGDERRARTALGQPEAPERDRNREDGRLGLVGLVQVLFRTILDQRPKVVTERLGGLGEGIAHQRLLGAQLGQHAEGLRTLAREDECEGCRH